MQPHITTIGIAYQPWDGTHEHPRFKKPVYRVEYETAEGQRQNALQFPAVDAIEARQIASCALNIPFSMGA